MGGLSKPEADALYTPLPHATDTANPHATTAAQVGAPTTADLTTHTGRTDNPHTVTKAQVGLANADNTSDANKPISIATQAALDTKQPIDTFPAAYTIQDHFISGTPASGSIGELRWHILSGTIGTAQSEAGRPGIFTRSTSATAGTLASMFVRNSSWTIHTANSFDMTVMIRPSTITDVMLRFGLLGTTTGNPPPDGIYLEKLTTDTNWFAVCRTASVETRVNTGVAQGTAWTRLRLRMINSTTIGFSVNGGTENQVTTNIPSTTAAPTIYIHNGAEAINKSFDIDWFSLSLTGLLA